VLNYEEIRNKKLVIKNEKKIIILYGTTPQLPVNVANSKMAIKALSFGLLAYLERVNRH